ncbi:hypothetical protein OB981_29345 [Bacillus cereus]|nr:hypothetical protein [Bacillus cereus]
MVNKLGMTKEQQQRFLAPIIKYMLKNPHLFNLAQKQSISKTKYQKESSKK